MKILRNLLFYLLAFLLCFFVGIQYANIIEAGKGQMMAGGAIVLLHGIVGAGVGLIISIFLSIYFKKKPKVLIQSNKIMALLILIFIAFFWIKYQVKLSQVDTNTGHILQIEGVHSEKGYLKSKSIVIELIFSMKV